jgi:hypothetical protein
VTGKQATVPDGKPGFRDVAYYSVQSAISLLREPTSEPLTTIGRISEVTLRLLGPLLLGLALLALRGRVNGEQARSRVASGQRSSITPMLLKP